MSKAMYIIGGDVLPGYERIFEEFEANFADGNEHCAQVCAFVRGRKVVDLWGARKHRDTEEPLHNYGPSSLQNIWSSSKALTSLVVAMHVDRGHLRYDQRIADIWPEYAKHGKQDTTVAMVMRHEAGLSQFDKPLDALELTAERIRSGSVSDIIADQKPKSVPGKERVYHGITRGWIVNEVVRRVDPQGRTVGEFLRDEVARPLGLENELAIGLPGALHNKLAPLHKRSKRQELAQFLLPEAVTGKIPGVESWKVRAGMALFTTMMGTLEVLGRTPAELAIGGDIKTVKTKQQAFRFNRPEVRRCEIPSANAHASARALAAVAAALAEGGTCPPSEFCSAHQLLTEKGLAEAVGGIDVKPMFGVPQAFTNAGWCEFDKASGREGFVGWMGWGGSVLQFHPTERIGFGYAMNLMEPILWNARALKLQSILMECVQAVSTGTNAVVASGGLDSSAVRSRL